MIKKIFLSIITVFFFSCLKEDILTVKSEFTFTETNLLDGKKLSFNNMSQNGDTFKWTFQNGLPATSDKFNPGDVIFKTAGLHTIKLEVKNRDGSSDIIEKQVDVSLVANVNFTTEILVNEFAPAIIKIINLTTNVSSQQWIFEGGNPATFSGSTPPNVTYTTPGIKTLRLITNAGEKNVDIEIKPALSVDFNYIIKEIDNNMNAPVKLFFNNTSVSALTYNWEITGPANFNFTSINPNVILPLAGNYQVKLTASNVKETFSKTLNVNVLAYTNLATQNNIELGIAAAQNTIGVSYSTINKKVYKSSEINSTNGSEIDVLFYGINATFGFCAFVSPNNTNGFGLTSIPNATNTIFNNKQEENSASIPLITSLDFDALVNENNIQNITIPANNNLFNSNTIPRIIPFKTQDGRKGLIKLKSIIPDGNNSRIAIDIKVQKH